MIRLAMILALLAGEAAAEGSLVATRAIQAQTLVEPDDVRLTSPAVPGALTEAASAVGLEARVTIYPGRPVRPGDLGPPALVERNDTVRLLYAVGGLQIAALGRALGRGAEGMAIRVMNVDSRAIVHGRVAGPGLVEVGK
ncbi:MAG: flagellar basal body P-ring formation chaperone FlgA [Pseudomonadota bacterium]